MKSVKYIEKILKRKSFRDFLEAMNNVVDIKEWSETGTLFDLCSRIMSFYRPRFIFDIGCGKRPTLATLMALNYKDTVIAIDPNLSNEYAKNIYNLYLISKKLKDIKIRKTNHKVLVLCNHSHTTSKEMVSFLNNFQEWIYITVPCCVDNKIPNVISLSYIGKHSHSPKNEIHIYSNIQSNLNKILGA